MIQKRLFSGGTLGAIAFAVLAVIPAAWSTELNNQLKDHPAPYLALHGNDPVVWQRWDADTVRFAQENNKILYLSVGYFACHWCHVMQRESYQNDAIAAVINQNFVPVKIDRELEPALDSRLMDFTQRTLGRGGWPLNVFVTPDGYPIYSVLYLPPEHFLATLKRMQALWSDDQERILNLVRIEATSTFPDAEPRLHTEASQRLLDLSIGSIMQRADMLEGGFGQQNKFPSAPQLQYLLSSYDKSTAADIGEFLELTLDTMASQGMVDHLLGGFFRYTVDPGWAVPHFEKMLYDNANLATLYLQAARVMANPDYLAVARRTLDFMQSRMWHPDGALVASFSSVDDDEVEGGHYLWRSSQLRELLNQAEFKLITTMWDLDRPDELEAGNQPRINYTAEQYAVSTDIPLQDVQTILASATEKMLNLRDKRSLPVDDKLLAGWNGLALAAFAKAARQLPDSGYDKTAAALRNFLVERLWDGNQLTRALARGQLAGSASLEDYAYVANGLFHWAELTGEAADYQQALDVVKAGWQRFNRLNGWYQEDGTLLAPSSASELIPDGASASPAAVLIATSLKLARYFDDKALENSALSALNRGDDLLMNASFWYASQLDAISVAILE